VIFEWNLFSVVTYFVYFSFDRIIVQELVSFIYPFFLSSRYHDVIVLYYLLLLLIIMSLDSLI
jgi:hypothetical protein